jgi:SAM-dependent methyltransferase
MGKIDSSNIQTESMALNAVCPYYTMFPIDYPLSILRQAGKRRLRVLDPFCGRGTTVFAARLLGHEGFGIDSSKVAVAIAKAKIANCDAHDVLELAEKLLAEKSSVDLPQGEFWEWAYEEKTLAAVCRLRAGLLHARSDAENLLRAVCLGALHGPLAKNIENAGYFSNQMPRTFASKPVYSVKFWRERKMRPKAIDVTAVVARRVERLDLKNIRRAPGGPQIRRGDSATSTAYCGIPRPIDTVISSPPYYGMKTYIADQWLRNWFVGGPSVVRYSEREQLCHHSLGDFTLSLAGVWDRVGVLLVDNGRMYMRFGAIPSRKSDAREIMLNSLGCSRHNWTVKSILGAHSAEFGKRQAEQMGKRVKSSAIEEFDFEIARDA